MVSITRMKAESNHACLDGFARGSLEDGEGEEEVCDEDGHCTLDAMARARSVKSRVGRVVCNKELTQRDDDSRCRGLPHALCPPLGGHSPRAAHAADDGPKDYRLEDQSKDV